MTEFLISVTSDLINGTNIFNKSLLVGFIGLHGVEMEEVFNERDFVCEPSMHPWPLK